MSADDRRSRQPPTPKEAKKATGEAASVRRAGRIDVDERVYARRRAQQARRRAKQDRDAFDPAPPDEDDWVVPEEDTDGLRKVGPPTPLGDTLNELIERQGWGERLGASRMAARWEEIVGPELAQRCEPLRLAGGTLVIRAATPTWATQLRYLTPQLKANAVQVLGPGAVREVRVTVGDLSEDAPS